MANAQELLFSRHQEAQEKYTYFLLAGVGAAIALVVTQTQRDVLAWSQAPLGVAIAMWALSFYCGCRQLRAVQSALYVNLDLLKIEAGTHPMAGRDPQRMAVGHEVATEFVTQHVDSAQRFGIWQFRLFVLAAIFYIGWHVYEMWTRAIAAPVSI